jgi:hypothetical protein
VTVTKHSCAECGVEIAQAATGRPRHTCSDACRSRAYRRRRRDESRNGFVIPPRTACDLQGPVRLTAGMREALRLEIDRRRRKLIEERAEISAADRVLFREDEAEA